MSAISDKKKRITDHIVKTISLLEPQENGKKWLEKLNAMTDEQFDFFMTALKEEKEVLSIDVPNMKIILKYENCRKAADHLGIDFFHHLRIKDPITKIEFVTPQKYLVLELPIRRLQQTVYEKMSIPVDDKKIDGLTGQVTGDDRACSITYPEIQALKAQGFKEVLNELVVARGGNINAYAKLKQDLEDLGESDLKNVIDPNSISRSTMMLDVLLASMGYETNLVNK